MGTISKFSTRHYEVLASAIKEFHEEHCKQEGREMMQEFCDGALCPRLAYDNPNFNYRYFMQASGLEVDN